MWDVENTIYRVNLRGNEVNLQKNIKYIHIIEKVSKLAVRDNGVGKPCE